MGNPYREQIVQTLPRLLALFDRDPNSDTLGVGDRFRWAWGLIDFGNGTFQGAAHGLARLWCAGLWPYATDPAVFHERIDQLFSGAKRLTRSDGSLEEAFPFEGSFCVTALVAFDLLCAIDILEEELPRSTIERWQTIVQPLIGFVMKSDETHAVISNHLATAVAALTRWHRRTADASAQQRALALLQRILEHQSDEGWLKEYEGADPGYQTLGTYYLADIHRLRPDWNLREPLARSIDFLRYCVHPDGSFGGIYGSRCTRFYYPAGLEALAAEIPAAASIAVRQRQAIAQKQVVTLSSMDEPNLIPMFNAYCWAAALQQDTRTDHVIEPLPAFARTKLRVSFPHAGLLFDAGPRHYSVVNANKGGTVLHFIDGRAALNDGGIVVRDRRGRLGSTQCWEDDTLPDDIGANLVIESPIAEMPKQLPSPGQFLVLRIACLTVFRFPFVREWVKQQLVRLLITRRSYWRARNRRQIKLGVDLVINDEQVDADGCARVSTSREFVAIHMASQGYWQMQDEEAVR